ncbi:B-cell receptor CD22-like isoform X1 [Pygocentrus nattereri]|uniref:Ig-like domain-containing protein n=2 Tax=Pygocentrus nattereri TaxID=42514 RepID=A0AAR2JQU2_PYGNA|nr:B-cell receptor CD22-like isoform X1 [Pygocentrus nattereri]
MDFTQNVLQLILLLSISGCLGESGSCSPQTICALRDSEVTMKCSYPDISIKTVFWFGFKQKAKWKNETQPEDLALDSDYKQRANFKKTRSSSTFTIRELRERDSGEYHLMIITEQGQKHLNISTAVNLTVTDLWVKMTTDHKQQTVTLTCSTSCSLTSKPKNYYWYKNGVKTQKKASKNLQPLVLSSKASCLDAGSYSCSVSDTEEIRSSELRVFESCWNVTYTDRRLCVLEGSSVDLPCTFSYASNQTVTDVFWYYYSLEEKPKELSKEKQFAGRVEYIGDKERNCTLRMRDVRKRDSGEYRFQFRIDTQEGMFSGKAEVFLNITDLQVNSSTASDGQMVTLMCSTICTLPNNPTYFWYRNRQPVPNKVTRDNKLYLNSTSSEDLLQYSCTLQSPEDSSVLLTVGVSVFLVLILITAALWMWRRKFMSSEDHRSTGENEQDNSSPVYGNISALALTSDSACTASNDQNDILYYNLRFKHTHTQEMPVYHTKFAKRTRESVHYAVVNFHRPAATQSLAAVRTDDPF